MPLTRISLRRGKSAGYKTAVMDSVYAAMRETFAVPEDDRFMIIDERDPEDMIFGRTYLGIMRSDDLVIIQITCNGTRDTAQKKALYKAIAEKLADAPGVRPQDVFVNLVEVKAENWSFGNGVAQYA